MTDVQGAVLAAGNVAEPQIDTTAHRVDHPPSPPFEAKPQALGDGDLTFEQLDGMELWDRDVMLDERHRAIGSMLVRRAVSEIRRRRASRDAHAERAADLARRVTELETMVNTPRIDDFFEAVRLEAAHQVERWGTEHDDGKDHAAWHSLVATLLAKATLAHWAKDWAKRTHHLISSAAALLNWHRRITGDSTAMRPGVAVDHEAAP